MSLRKNLIKLAHDKPELRKDLLPLLGQQKRASDQSAKIVQALRKSFKDGMEEGPLWDFTDGPETHQEAMSRVAKAASTLARNRWVKDPSAFDEIATDLEEAAFYAGLAQGRHGKRAAGPMDWATARVPIGRHRVRITTDPDHVDFMVNSVKARKGKLRLDKVGRNFIEVSGDAYPLTRFIQSITGASTYAGREFDFEVKGL